MGNVKQIESEVYVPNPDKPGYLKLERTKSIMEVFDELVINLKEHDVYDELENFNITMGVDKKADFPNARIVACFVAEGNSEGHYIHIDIITSFDRETVFLGKTFMGIEHALEVSNICTQSFYK